MLAFCTAVRESQQWGNRNLAGINGQDEARTTGLTSRLSLGTDWPLPKLQEYFKNDTLALIGYGSQGHGQGLNARDNGINVIVGVREGGESWKQAQEDGWVRYPPQRVFAEDVGKRPRETDDAWANAQVPGKTLFPIEEAINKGTIIMNLLSDAAQSQTWKDIKPLIVRLLWLVRGALRRPVSFPEWRLTPASPPSLATQTKDKTLYFSHGFSLVYAKDTGVTAPEGIDVILCAPKGSGRTVRTLFKEGRGINASIAVWQDATGKAMEKARALAVAVGTGYAYETTFEKEVYSDLYGERGVLMGGIQGMFLAQYKVLRENGHSPSEAFNETVEEATQSLFPLIGQYGMDYMYNGAPFPRLLVSRDRALTCPFASVATLVPSLRFLRPRLLHSLPSSSPALSLLDHCPPWRPRLGPDLRGRQQAGL